MGISPLAPKKYTVLPPLDGVRIAVAKAGIKYADRADLMLMVFDAPAAVAGVFTTSRCASAPVDWCRSVLADAGATTRGFVVNSGNANAFTGKKGAAATQMTAQAAAKAISCNPSDILLASTGVIGEPLDASRFEGLLADMAPAAQTDLWLDAAKAIMTTDTYPKVATASVDLGVKRVTINGIAKGSGMIAPDMATMLSFIVTDAAIDQPVLQAMLSGLTPSTYNSVTVDSDTSTSDTVLLAATATAGNQAIVVADSDDASAFRGALEIVMHDLAIQIVRDGEGATKQVEIHVRGADSDTSARRIALSIANSPLVKTAVAGEDANWGRVVMAVGKAGEPADRDRLAIWFGDVRVAVDGERDPDYSEDAATAVMKRDEITIGVDIGLGDGQARVWTCDLTKEYVAINGDYRS
ncbi:bifunctional glutamate N-acetyltransferase/amino-acid acetyltransferase ArgJ [Pseudahrensia aquimaris]|uniref:Arginine biosynthesis bifunctional protein ArgJ n=1 Tax=Pseudahrensia aquimaris TaxID=744461 RepID=A0ABW3FE47_9HYPH